MPTSDDQGPGDETPKTAPFTSPPSTRALALVGIAVLVGLLLVVIVNSDKDDKKTSAATVSTTSTTTTAAKTDTTEKKSSTTSSTKPVANTTKPADVSVLVLNGSSGTGVATQVSNEIGSMGYKTLTPGNDSSKDNGTIVYYKSGFENDAKQLATNIVPGILNDLDLTQTVKTAQFPASAPVAWDQQNLVAANVVVVVGNPTT